MHHGRRKAAAEFCGNAQRIYEAFTRLLLSEHSCPESGEDYNRFPAVLPVRAVWSEVPEGSKAILGTHNIATE